MEKENGIEIKDIEWRNTVEWNRDTEWRNRIEQRLKTEKQRLETYKKKV